jgi:4-amino-4-deoxy-L-arabinose transferase-like glycosyltransferase
MGWLVALIAVAWILSKSTGAIILGSLGLLLLAVPAARWLRLSIMVSILAYLTLRLIGDGLLEQVLVDAAGLISTERASSLQFRYTNEGALLDRFWRNPLFGSSPWGFTTHVGGESGTWKLYAVPDSLWIYAVSVNGLTGLVAVISSLWIPAARGLGLASRWRSRIAPEVFVCGLIVMMYLIDSLANGFKTPVYVLIAGGLSRASPLRVAVTGQAQPERVTCRTPLQPRTAAGGVHRENVIEPCDRSSDKHSAWLRSRDRK